MNKNQEYKNMVEQIAANHQLSSFDKAHLDRTYKAVTLQELDFVIENTSSKAVQDFALAKKLFYVSKGMK